MAQKTFKAVANVNFFIQLTNFPEVRAFNKAKLAELREINPDVRELPPNHTYQLVVIGQELEFGEKLEMDDGGIVKIFPASYFEQQKDQMVELPSPLFGEVSEKAIDEKFSGLPAHLARDFKAKLSQENLLKSRFVYKPRLSKVETGKVEKAE